MPQATDKYQTAKLYRGLTVDKKRGQGEEDRKSRD